jgi:chromosome segregation ATPase
MNIEELKKEHERVGQCILDNQVELDRVKERLSKATPQLAEGTDELEDLRKERQGILVAENDPKTINTTIKKHKEKQEMLEDEITGLEQRLDVLNEQRPSLEKQKLALEQKILLEAKIRPLVDKYNVLANNMATILTLLEKNIFTYALIKTDPLQPPPVGPSGRHGSKAEWEESALSSIPSLTVDGDKAQPHIYSRHTLLNTLKTTYTSEVTQRRAEINLAAKEEYDTEHAALQDKYKGAKCFECNGYMGMQNLDGIKTLACVKFEEGIPEKILLGGDVSSCDRLRA